MKAFRPRVLIVDDEPRNLSVLEALLATFDVEITRASGGREAVDAYTRALVSGGVDLVLLDVMMPEVDGLTALGEMRRATPPEQRIPIVLVTALGAREDRLRGLEAGADDFLTKPLDPNEVRCRVKTFLALHAAQRALRARAEQLESLQRGKLELTRMLVHDLKNPLGGVGTNLGWIDRRLRKHAIVDDDLFEALADARAGAKRLLSLVTGLIEVEKAETGQLEVRRRTTRIGDLLESVARQHAKTAEEKGATLHVEADSTLEAELDPDLVTRVLENLVENATRYAGRAGRIALIAGHERGVVELSVANTGEVIPEELRATIFDKHVSGEDRGARGTNLGLGLYFCKLAAEAHGATIGVDSSPSWPTRFVLRFPAPKKLPVREASGTDKRAPPPALLD